MSVPMHQEFTTKLSSVPLRQSIYPVILLSIQYPEVLEIEGKKEKGILQTYTEKAFPKHPVLLKETLS